MKLLPLLSVFFFTYCFTIYTKNETILESQNIDSTNISEKGIGGCDLYVCGAILVIATTTMVLEMTTLPFRVMSEPKERIQI